jgi:hypothetical protein
MKAKTKSRKNHLPKMPWSVVADDLKRRGNWSLVNSTPKIKIFQRRNERLVAVKLGRNEWKAEYFQSGRLMDTSGAWNEEFVKKMIYEMGVYRSY